MQTSKRLIIETSGAGKYRGPIVKSEIAIGNIKTPLIKRKTHWELDRAGKRASGYEITAAIKKDRHKAGIILIFFDPLTTT